MTAVLAWTQKLLIAVRKRTIAAKTLLTGKLLALPGSKEMVKLIAKERKSLV